MKRGHTLAVHTYTHRYEEIYASPEAYLSDFSQLDVLHDIVNSYKETLHNSQ